MFNKSLYTRARRHSSEDWFGTDEGSPPSQLHFKSPSHPPRTYSCRIWWWQSEPDNSNPWTTGLYQILREINMDTPFCIPGVITVDAGRLQGDNSTDSNQVGCSVVFCNNSMGLDALQTKPWGNSHCTWNCSLKRPRSQTGGAPSPGSFCEKWVCAISTPSNRRGWLHLTTFAFNGITSYN